MLAIRRPAVVASDKLSEPATVLVAGGRIREVGPADMPVPPGYEILDAEGLILSPGFIDLQFNGAYGHDFTFDPERIWEVAARLPQYGVTAFLPTIITSPPETVRRAQDVLLRGAPDGFVGAHPLGLHLEGPFLNPGKKGAHNPGYLRPPSLEAVSGWSPETGVRLVTMAPELPGALPVIEALTARGVVVSAGHSLATAEQAQAGFDAGVRYATHLFNAMPAPLHREPGLVVAALTDPRVIVGLIPDGLHVHPAWVRLARQAIGSDRLNVVTDAMAALGMPPGEYLLGDYRVTVDETAARLDEFTLAGCIMPLDACLRNLMDFAGCSMPEALATATTTPAGLLNLHHKLGEICVGAAADLVLLRRDLSVEMTIIGGRVVYSVN